MKLIDVMSTKEAADKWGISESNLRNALNRFGRFEKQMKAGKVKKSANTWLVTVQAMLEVFGEPRGGDQE